MNSCEYWSSHARTLNGMHCSWTVINCSLLSDLELKMLQHRAIHGYSKKNCRAALRQRRRCRFRWQARRSWASHDLALFRWFNYRKTEVLNRSVCRAKQPPDLSKQVQDAQAMFIVCVVEVVGAHAEVQIVGNFAFDPSKQHIPIRLIFCPAWNQMWPSCGPAVAVE